MWPLKDRVAVIYTSFIYTLPPAESIKRETRVQGNKYVCTAAVEPVCIYKNNSPAQCFSYCFSFLFLRGGAAYKIFMPQIVKGERRKSHSARPLIGSTYTAYISWRKGNIKDSSTSLTCVLSLVYRAKYCEIFSPYCSYLPSPRVLWFYSHSRSNNKLTFIMELHPSRFLLHPQLMSTCRRADAKSSGSLQRCWEVNRSRCWIALLQLPAEWWVDQVAANLRVWRASLRSQFQNQRWCLGHKASGAWCQQT